MLKQNWLKDPLFISFSFALLIFVVRVFLRAHYLEMDEAEQMVFAQHLSKGYPAQPPLYSWLQFFLFKGLGANLISLALLKSILLFGCFYCYHQICRLHCHTVSLAWCATAAWAFILAISFDLMKDNTHSVFVLLSACLTWYWFVAPSSNKTVWYAVLGVILGIGFLSKYNYLLFVVILGLSALSLKNDRKKLRHPAILLSFSIALLIASPYLYWLMTHSDLGLHSTYKFMSTAKNSGQGLFQLTGAIAYFALPTLLISYCYFPIKRVFIASNNQLLITYHLIALPVLFLLIFFAGITHIETRWLIPLLFLLPVLFFSQVKEDNKNIRSYLILAICVQCLLFTALIYRSYYGNTTLNRFPMQNAIESIKKEASPIDYIASDSIWILGNMMLELSVKKGSLIHPAALPKIPSEHVLFIWQTPNPPIWTYYYIGPEQVNQKLPILSSKDKEVRGGFLIK